MVRIVAVLVSVALVGCGPSLTEEQRAWCHDNDHLSPTTRVNLLVNAALKLDLAVPDKVVEGDDLARSPVGDGGRRPEGYQPALDQWRSTEDYARACVAAFDGPQRIRDLGLGRAVRQEAGLPAV